MDNQVQQMYNLMAQGRLPQQQQEAVHPLEHVMRMLQTPQGDGFNPMPQANLQQLMQILSRQSQVRPVVNNQIR